MKSTIPFPIGPNGFVRLMPSYSPRLSPSDSPLNAPRSIDGPGSHLEDTSPALSLQGPTDYFSLRRPAGYRSTQPIIQSSVSPTPSFYPSPSSYASPSSALRAGITSNETLRWLRSTTNSDPISDSAFTSSSNLVLGTATSSSNATPTPTLGHPLDRASMAFPTLNHPLFPPEFDLSIVELMTLTRRYRRRAFASRNRRVDETETSSESLSSSLESQETVESDELMELPAGQELGDNALVAETDEMEGDVMSMCTLRYKSCPRDRIALSSSHRMHCRQTHLSTARRTNAETGYDRGLLTMLYYSNTQTISFSAVVPSSCMNFLCPRHNEDQALSSFYLQFSGSILRNSFNWT